MPKSESYRRKIKGAVKKKKVFGSVRRKRIKKKKRVYEPKSLGVQKTSAIIETEIRNDDSPSKQRG